MIEKQMRVFGGCGTFVTITHFDGVGRYGNHTHNYYRVTKSSKKRVAELFNHAKHRTTNYTAGMFVVSDDMTPSVELHRK